jgi:hypothetical protein
MRVEETLTFGAVLVHLLLKLRLHALIDALGVRRRQVGLRIRTSMISMPSVVMFRLQRGA